MDILGLVLVLACVVGILYVMVGRGRRGPGARRLSDFQGYSSPGGLGGGVSGLVAAVAVSGAMNLGGIPFGTAAGIGAVVGALFAVIAAVGSRLVLNIATAGFALLGIGAAVTGFLPPPTCAAVDTSIRMLILVILGICSAGGIATALVTGRFRMAAPLAIFGVMKVLTFLAAPLGVSLVQLPVAAWLVGCIAAALFGFAAGVAPDVVIGLAAIAIGLSALGTVAVVGTPCSADDQSGDLGTLLGYLVVYGLVRTVLRAVFRR